MPDPSQQQAPQQVPPDEATEENMTQEQIDQFRAKIRIEINEELRAYFRGE